MNEAVLQVAPVQAHKAGHGDRSISEEAWAPRGNTVIVSAALHVEHSSHESVVISMILELQPVQFSTPVNIG